ncbi:MAG TPA: pitrilysin family protein [Cyclobacteriaceae bacterium]|nr:pitrilysin family protein [Cyclobacteriaceae bacterium]
MLDRKTPPPSSRFDTISLPSPQEFNTSDQLKVYFIDEVQQPIVKIDVLFKAGKWFEPKNGVSNLTASMLEKGTATKSSAEIANIFDQCGAFLEISPGFDFVSVSLYSLTKKLDDALSLFIEILQHSAFVQHEFKQLTDIQLQNIKVNNEKNSYVASKLIRKNVFGANHPYGNSLEESDVKNIIQEDLIGFYQARFSPFEVYVIGKIDQDIQNKIRSKFSEFTARNKNEVNSHNSTYRSTIQKVEKTNSVQTSIRLGKKTVLRSHADYPQIIFLNHILGGYFGSRLMKNIREEKGLTYGIHSSINPFLHDSFFSISADVSKGDQDLAIQEIKNEISELQTKPISSEELEVSKNHFLGSLQLDMANPFSVAEKIKNIKLHQLPENYYQNLFASILSVQEQDLITIAQRYFNIDELSQITVG